MILQALTEYYQVLYRQGKIAAPGWSPVKVTFALCIGDDGGLEQVIDILVERLRAQHIKRLKEGACSIDTGVVYLDVLNNVERISDHCSNIAARLVGMEAGEDYDSHTLKNMMHHNPTKEYMLNYEQCRKDYLVPLEQLEA